MEEGQNGELRVPQNTPGLFFHKVTDAAVLAEMEGVRRYFLALDNHILTVCPNSRERSIALTHLQTALMFAIASLAIAGGERQLPAEYVG